MANQNHLRSCISLAMVAMAARQGLFSRLKTRKEKPAAAQGNQVPTAAATAPVSSTRSSDTLASTPMVETMASLAVKPEMEEATGCHWPKPRGAKSTAMALPITARREAEVSSTRPKAPFSKPKLERNHMTTQARKRMVPALIR